MLKNKIYDICKYIALIVIPALVVLIQTLGGVWGWSYVNEITTSIAAVGVFLGALLGISTKIYNNNSKKVQ